jgi:hypothetical protein
LLLHLQRFQSAHDRNPQFLCAHEGGALRVSLGLSQEAPGEKGPACFLSNGEIAFFIARARMCARARAPFEGSTR